MVVRLSGLRCATLQHDPARLLLRLRQHRGHTSTRRTRLRPYTNDARWAGVKPETPSRARARATERQSSQASICTATLTKEASSLRRQPTFGRFSPPPSPSAAGGGVLLPKKAVRGFWARNVHALVSLSGAHDGRGRCAIASSASLSGQTAAGSVALEEARSSA